MRILVAAAFMSLSLSALAQSTLPWNYMKPFWIAKQFEKSEVFKISKEKVEQEIDLSCKKKSTITDTWKATVTYVAKCEDDKVSGYTIHATYTEPNQEFVFKTESYEITYKASF